jgi:hypothetical protein
MTASSRRAFALSFADTVPILAKACELNIEARGAIEARVRQLQRLGLDAPGSLQSRKPAYGLLELAELATAFQFMAAFMLPKRAVRYVTEQRETLLPFYLAGASPTAPTSWSGKSKYRDKRFAIIRGTGLVELGQNEQHGKRYMGELSAIDLVGDGSLSKAAKPLNGAGVVIDSAAFLPSLFAQTINHVFASEAEVCLELDRIRFAALPINSPPG